MDVDSPSQSQLRASEPTPNGDSSTSANSQLHKSADTAIDVDTSSSAAEPSAGAGTPIVQEKTTEIAVTKVNGETVEETMTTTSSTYPEAQPPQTINPADLFSIPPASNSDATSTDVSMTEARAPASAPVPTPSPHIQTGSTNAPAGPSTLSSLDTSVVSRPNLPSPARIYRTGYIYDPLMMLHCPDGYTPTSDDAQNGDNHPEEPMRIKRIYSRLSEHGLIKRMKKLDFQEVTFEQVMTVHSEGHWDKVQGTECRSFQGKRYVLMGSPE
jgi:hypothetical protein